MYIYFLAKPWKKSNKIIDLDFSDKPSITIEEYPNENMARIVLCTSHPEYMIWWDGQIKEEPIHKYHTMGEGFHRWHDIKPLSKTFSDEFTATWWLVRRFVAWTAKIPDKHLPPIEKGIMNEDAQKILSENIFWDGTIVNQMKNI